MDQEDNLHLLVQPQVTDLIRFFSKTLALRKLYQMLPLLAIAQLRHGHRACPKQPPKLVLEKLCQIVRPPRKITHPLENPHPETLKTPAIIRKNYSDPSLSRERRGVLLLLSQRGRRSRHKSQAESKS